MDKQERNARLAQVILSNEELEMMNELRVKMKMCSKSHVLRQALEALYEDSLTWEAKPGNFDAVLNEDGEVVNVRREDWSSWDDDEMVIATKGDNNV